MFKESIAPLGTTAATVASWFFRGIFDRWFFSHVIGMAESPNGLVGGLVEYGPPAILLLITARLWWGVVRQKSRDKIPQPDMSLEEVVNRITGRPTLPLSTDAESVPVLTACESLREKALLGTIDVFGGINWRTTRPKDYGSMIRDKIKPEYWRSHHIDVIGFLGDDDRRGRTSSLANNAFEEGFHGAESDCYYGIWFSRNQIDAIWPPPRKKIKFRAPITLETA